MSSNARNLADQGTVASATLGSASTVNIYDANTPTVLISGSNAITGFDAGQPGARRRLIFQATLTLTHNANNLILPGLSNIITSAGDVADFECLAVGVWRCVNYVRASGQPLVGLGLVRINASAVGQTSFPVPGGYPVGSALLVYLIGALLDPTDYTATDGMNIVLAKGVKRITDYISVGVLGANAASDPSKLPLAGGSLSGALNWAPPAALADSATPAIGAASSNNVTLNGTTTVTGFDTVVVGAVRVVKFAGVRVLTHDAAKLILPGAANITTQVGDTAVFRSLGSGNWECISYLRADGSALNSVISKEWAGATQTPTGGTRTTYTHNLGAIPENSTLEMVCLVANNGFAVGDTTHALNIQGTSGSFGYILQWTATTVTIVIAAAGLAILNSSYTWTNVTASQWAVRARGWL